MGELVELREDPPMVLAATNAERARREAQRHLSAGQSMLYLSDWTACISEWERTLELLSKGIESVRSLRRLEMSR